MELTPICLRILSRSAEETEINESMEEYTCFARAIVAFGIG